MALPTGKKNPNMSQAAEKNPSGALPKGPSRIPTGPVTPQKAAETPKKGKGLGVGEKAK